MTPSRRAGRWFAAVALVAAGRVLLVVLASAVMASRAELRLA
jgi:hypothetical protein